MQHAVSRSFRETSGFEFSHIQSFAGYLLQHHLDHFVNELFLAYEKIDIPLVRSFRTLTPEERRSVLTRSAHQMLSLVAANKLDEYVDKTIRNWLTKDLPRVLQDQISVGDIILVAYTRERVLRKFMRVYTSDAELWLSLVEEMSNLTAVLSSEAFSLYVDRQHEQMRKINVALTKRKRELLEAQEIGNRTIQQLEENANLYKQAQALTHIGNWSLNIRNNKMAWSDEMYRIYGLAPQSESITLKRWLSFVHQDDLATRKREIRKFLSKRSVEEYYVRIKAADGTEKILRGKGEVVTDAKGSPIRMHGTCQDVTHEVTLTQQLRERERYLEELNASLKLANRELRRTNEELESFNFIASHDLQEPLRKIQLYSNRISENPAFTLPKKLQDDLGKIAFAAKRMQNLIDDFLAFTQTIDAQQSMESVNINEVVEEIRMELAERLETGGARIHVGALPSVRAVRLQIKQLLLNLITNALKYKREDTIPHIRISGSILAGKDLKFPDADPSTMYVTIEVRDNGIGFDPKYRLKIFELFQRLHVKQAYSGTGIGLALCKKIVQSLGGFITADSRPGQGSLFAFYIPRRKRE